MNGLAVARHFCIPIYSSTVGAVYQGVKLGVRIYDAELGVRIYGVELSVKSPSCLCRAQDLGANNDGAE